MLVEEQALAGIAARQARIPGLKVDEFGCTSVWGGELTPGCRDCCLTGKAVMIRSTSKCQLDCDFCYYYRQKDHPYSETLPTRAFMVGDRRLREEDVRLLFSVQARDHISGVGWLYFEPLLEYRKMLPLMRFFRDLGLHQWLYTNGLAAARDVLSELSDAGLDEIRFNLAATDCSNRVLANMRGARQLFKYVCVESPMFTRYFHAFMKKRAAILDTGVDHIHFAELELFPASAALFAAEGLPYRHREEYISPLKSRQLTYDVFETAAREGWKGVVLHDCSNQVKLLRGMRSAPMFSGINYKNPRPGVFTPAYYRDAVRGLPASALAGYIEELGRAIARTPKAEDNYLNLARLHADRGEAAKALTVLQRGAAACRGSPAIAGASAELRAPARTAPPTAGDRGKAARPAGPRRRSRAPSTRP
jgi:uncharacterized protein